MLRKSISPVMVDLPVPALKLEKASLQRERAVLLLKTLVRIAFPNLFMIFYCESTGLEASLSFSLSATKQG